MKQNNVRLDSIKIKFLLFSHINQSLILYLKLSFFQKFSSLKKRKLNYRTLDNFLLCKIDSRLFYTLGFFRLLFHRFYDKWKEYWPSSEAILSFSLKTSLLE